MVTTIQVPDALKERLKRLKRHPRQPYAEVIQEALDWLEEDESELSDEAKGALAESRRQFEQGNFRTLDEVREELNL